MIIAALVAVQACAMPPAALGEVFWFVQESSIDAEATSLCAMAPGSGSDHFTPLRLLTGPPVAIAANGSTVWLAATSNDRPGGAVSLLAFRAEWDPRLETWLAQPASGMNRLPVPDLRTSVDRLIASEGGPIVVGASGSGEGRPVAVLRRGDWRNLPDLPVDGAVPAAVETGGVLLVLAVGAAGTPSIWRCEVEGGSWTETPLVLEGDPHDLLAMDTGVLVGSQLDGNVRAVGFLQDEAVVPWIRIDDVAADTRLLASGTDLMVYRQRDGEPWVASVDRGTGLAGPWRLLSPASGMGTRAWSILVSVFIGLAVVFVLFIGRGARPTEIPRGMAVAPLPRRGLAFGIDLVPGVLVSVLVMDVTSTDVLWAALSGPIPSTAVLLLLMAAVTAAWGMVWERSLGRTPGKRAMGLVTVSTGGGPMRLWQILVRNLLKGLIVLAPPIAIIVVLTPAGQSLGDVAAGTLVLIRRRAD